MDYTEAIDALSHIPTACIACNEPILLANLLVDDGCPCNSVRGVNFKPESCIICERPDCVKPGHRFMFGHIVTSRLKR